MPPRPPIGASFDKLSPVASKYKNGASRPTGGTEVQFQTVGLNFQVFHAVLERSKASGSALSFLFIGCQWANDSGEFYTHIPQLRKLLKLETDRAVQIIEPNSSLK